MHNWQLNWKTTTHSLASYKSRNDSVVTGVDYIVLDAVHLQEIKMET